MLLTKIRRCVEWNSPNVIATLVMVLLENYWILVTRLTVWLNGHSEDEAQKTVPVYDILNAGPNKCFMLINGELFHNCLGLQFGMFYKTLAVKLTMDMGRTVTERESKKLMDLHQKLYRVYWRWTKDIVRNHAKRQVTILHDGWAILKDAIENELSLINSPVQGTGGVILRDVAVASQESNIPFIAPLHDGVYAICKVEHKEQLSKAMDHYMDAATQKILGTELLIRIETEYHTHEETWVEGKGYKHYELLKKYLEYIPNTEDTTKQLLKTIYS